MTLLSSHPISYAQSRKFIICCRRVIVTLVLTTVPAALHVVDAQSSDTVVARLNGAAVTQKEVDDAIATQLFPLQQQIYALRKTALENLLSHKLLELEADRRGITIDELKKHMIAGDVTVTAEQVEKLYQQNLTAFALMSPDEAKEKLRLDLEAQSRLKKYREHLARLRDSSRIEFLLPEPRLRLNASMNPTASRGPQDAKVVLTEFSDFQCPYCKQAQPVLYRLFDEYRGRVRLEFRHLPLDMHPYAFLAAKATHCAGQQGKFWQYHDALFALESINKDSFTRIANDLGMNAMELDKCLVSSLTRAAILADTQEAARLGINGTPTLLINGQQFRGLIEFEELKRQIEQELRTTESASLHNGPLSVKERKK